MKSLIVNADDFGLSREVNAAVIRAHREGVITSASLMGAENAAREAADAARDNPQLDVGMHAVVCKDKSVLDAAALSGAVDSSGHFISNPVVAGMRYFFDRSMRSKLRDEMRAQIERHLELCGRLSHIDGHLNFHVHPVIADVLIDLAAEYKVPCMRMPREDVATTLAMRRDNAARKVVESVIFRALSRRARRIAHARGIRTNDWLFGLHQSGHLDEDYVVAVIGRLREGTTELYFHPAMDIGGAPPSPAAQREVAILTSARVRQAIDRAGVRLTTYREMAGVN